MRKTYHLGDNEKGFSFLWGPWDLSQVWWYKEFFQLEKTIFNSNFAKQTRSFWAFFYSAPYKNEIIMFFLLFFYFQISKKNKNYRKKIMTNFNFFLLVFLSLKMISFLIYFLVPVMYPLKHFYGNWDENNKEIIKKIIDEAHISGPTNALPSLHLISTTAAAMLFTGFIFSKKETNRLTYWTTKVICFFFWSAVTFLLFATVILKRHYLIDGITGILMTIFLWKWL
jgi:membrane-associated phospholipid phosphatase